MHIVMDEMVKKRYLDKVLRFCFTEFSHVSDRRKKSGLRRRLGKEEDEDPVVLALPCILTLERADLVTRADGVVDGDSRKDINCSIIVEMCLMTGRIQSEWESMALKNRKGFTNTIHILDHTR